MQLNKNNIVLRNFGYLSILNALNIALPLLSIPYITRVVGATNFGYYAYVLVLVQNINIITAHGFQFTATKEISQHRDDHAHIERTVSSVIMARLVVALGCIALVFAFSHWLLEGSSRFILFVTALGMILGDVFVPVWLFQGMERMKFVTIVNASSKILFTVLIFVLIQSSDDYLWLLLLNSMGFVLAAVLSMILVRTQFHIRLHLPAWQEVREQLRSSRTMFFSTLGIDLYRNLNTVILNFLVSPAAVGIYSLAEKFIKASQSFVTPISQALFPHVSLKVKTDGSRQSIPLIRKASYILIALTVVMAVALFLGSDVLVWITGKDFTQVKPLMMVMIPVLVFGCLNYLLGFVGLVNMGEQKFFFRVVMVSGTLSLVMLCVLARYLDAYAAAITMSMSEIILTIACVWKLYAIAKGEGEEL